MPQKIFLPKYVVRKKFTNVLIFAKRFLRSDLFAKNVVSAIFTKKFLAVRQLLQKMS
jgi:hypothetical protein